MSMSEWNSELDFDLNDINEEASIKVVKTSNLSQVSNIISQFPKVSTTKENEVHKTEKNTKPPQKAILTKQWSLGVMHQGHPKINVKESSGPLFEDIKSPALKNDSINERCNKFKEKVKAKIEKMSQNQQELEKKNCTKI